MQILGEDDDPEPRESGRLQGELVDGQVPGGELGGPPAIEVAGTRAARAAPLCPARPGTPESPASASGPAPRPGSWRSPRRLGPGEAPMTIRSWSSWPSPAVIERASSVNSRPAADLGDARGSRSRSFPDTASSVGTPNCPRFLASLTLVSRASQANAMSRPMSRPASSPPGRMIFFLGLLGVAGGVALVMIEPPEDAAA